MTDALRLPDPLPAARALPEGSAIIVRHTGDGERRRLAETLAPIARERKLRLLIAGDAQLAAGIGADGLHLPEARLNDGRVLRAQHPHWLITAAAHSEAAVHAAGEARADAVLLSPVFATPSHPGRTPIGGESFLAIAAAAPVPVYALGGITAANVALLDGPNVAGVAAIGALIPG